MKIDKPFLADFFNKTEQASAFGEPTKSVKRLVELLPSGAVLDIGAGDGRHALYLAEKGLQVTAVDFSEAGLRKLQRLARAKNVSIQTELADAAVYAPERAYEAMIVILLLQCLTAEAAPRLMKDIQEHTKPLGINVIHVFTNTGDRARLDREDDPRAFYPEEHWLKEFYGDWEILEHEILSAPLIGKFHQDGTSMTSVVERIMARKPREA